MYAQRNSAIYKCDRCLEERHLSKLQAKLATFSIEHFFFFLERSTYNHRGYSDVLFVGIFSKIEKLYIPLQGK